MYIHKVKVIIDSPYLLLFYIIVLFSIFLLKIKLILLIQTNNTLIEIYNQNR